MLPSPTHCIKETNPCRLINDNVFCTQNALVKTPGRANRAACFKLVNLCSGCVCCISSSQCLNTQSFVSFCFQIQRELSHSLPGSTRSVSHKQCIFYYKISTFHGKRPLFPREKHRFHTVCPTLGS